MRKTRLEHCLTQMYTVHVKVIHNCDSINTMLFIIGKCHLQINVRLFIDALHSDKYEWFLHDNRVRIFQIV